MPAEKSRSALIELHSVCSGVTATSVDGHLYIGAFPTDVRRVVHAALSEDGNLVAAVTLDKTVIALRRCTKTNTFTKLCKHSLPKRPTAIAFAPCGTLVVGDAFGDVFRLPQSGTVDTRDDDSGDDARALGHFSTVTTVCVTDGMIATADRDARIRISRWPNTFVIETFCMGHADAITALSVVTGGWVSGAADGVVKLWDESGRCRATVDVVEAGVPLRIARNDGVVSACSHEKGEEKDNGEKDADMEKPIVSTVAVCGTKRNRVVFAVDGSRSIYVLSGVNEGRLENCRQLTTFDDTVSGVSVDGDGMIWVSLSSRVELSWIRMKDVQDDNGDMVADKGTVKIVCEERLEKSKGNGGEGAGEGRFVWLAKQRKRAMTDEWKGKKRKHVEI